MTTSGDGYFLSDEIDELEESLHGELPIDLNPSRSSGDGISRDELQAILSEFTKALLAAIKAIRIEPVINIQPEIVARIEPYKELRRIRRGPDGKIESIESRVTGDQ